MNESTVVIYTFIGSSILGVVFLLFSHYARKRSSDGTNHRNTSKRQAEQKYALAGRVLDSNAIDKKATREIQRKMKTFAEGVTKRQMEHLEMMSAAYFKCTNIPPTEVELVQETDINSGRIRWYFKPHNDKGAA